jgi:hypothetical protein
MSYDYSQTSDDNLEFIESRRHLIYDSLKRKVCKPLYKSIKTMNTNKSIPNVYSRRKTFTVIMIDNKNNHYIENSYSGYGVFGGKDYFELLSEMNGLQTREEGINLYFSEKNNILYPNLIQMKKNTKWEWINEKPQYCEFQGFFY